MVYYRIVNLQDKYLMDAEHLFSKYSPLIFSKKELEDYRIMMLKYLMHSNATEKPVEVKVMLDEKKVIGVMIVDFPPDSPHYVEIASLAVEPSIQGKGYGTAFIKEMLLLLKIRGYKQVYLKTSNEKYNIRTKRFYKKNDFEKLAILPHYYPHLQPSPIKFEDCIIFHRHI